MRAVEDRKPSFPTGDTPSPRMGREFFCDLVDARTEF